MKRTFFLIIIISSLAFSQKSPHGSITIACEACHTSDSWKMRPDASFDHSKTGFSLEGRHTVLKCSSCHNNLSFTRQKTDCASCHTDVHKSELGQNCLRCHTTASWIIPEIKQKHQDTRFPLVGKHALAQCESCHNRASSHQYAGTPLECISCHKSEFDATSNPSHSREKFPLDCNQCHKMTAVSWAGGFDHSMTSFPLTGAHRNAICSQCHIDNKFSAIATDCYSCHQQDFSRTTSPNHTQGNFSHSCSSCHTTSAWNPATFDHNSTNFPLTGQHSMALCQSCHTNGNYNLTYSNCYQCHQTNFEQAANPNHQTTGFNQNCQTCHSTMSWSPASFDHATKAFPLTGSHVAVSCITCHTNNNYQISYLNCYQCHATDFQQPASPNHVMNNFNYTCEPCHTTTSWTPTTFSHSTTAFPLTGAHLATECSSCHTNGNYLLTYLECYTCHQADYERPVNPNHVQASFAHDCTPCHSTSVWKPSTFDHNSTNFPLTGQHSMALCQSCHTNGNYNLTYSNCYQCHQTDFVQATNPDHQTASFNQNCQTCHSTMSWSPASFDHATTAFPLTGSHVAVSCITCHTNNNYQISYANCYQCHQTDFERPASPNHVTNNFSYTCQPCHNTTTWSPSSFNHSTTQFPLTGVHSTTECASCHTNGNYQLTYNDCYTCHQTDYQRPTNPNHVQANFDHECTPCHSTSVWKPSTMNHDGQYFKIYSGRHRNRWTLCTDCHTTPTNFGTFSCIDCHEHSRNETDNDHRGVQNYQYASPACYSCHRNT